MDYQEIVKVIGREILDSRGNPTVEAEVTLADGTIGRGTAPCEDSMMAENVCMVAYPQFAVPSGFIDPS